MLQTKRMMTAIATEKRQRKQTYVISNNGPERFFMDAWYLRYSHAW